MIDGSYDFSQRKKYSTGEDAGAVLSFLRVRLGRMVADTSLCLIFATGRFGDSHRPSKGRFAGDSGRKVVIRPELGVFTPKTRDSLPTQAKGILTPVRCERIAHKIMEEASRPRISESFKQQIFQFLIDPRLLHFSR
jgi:hypothetical protein